MSKSQRFFQYLAGERKGEIVVLKDIIEEDGVIFIEFKDLSRCNEELIIPLNERNYTNQLMAEVSSPDNVWVLKEEIIGGQEEKWAPNADGKEVCVQEFVAGKKRIIPIPPKKVNSNFGKITERIETPDPIKQEEEEKKAKLSGDPVYSMMEAAKKFPTPVEVEISIMLPKRSLFEVAEESFDSGGEKVIEYIIENLDISDLKEALRKSLYQAYQQDESKKEKILKSEEVEVELHISPSEISIKEKKEPEIIRNDEIPEFFIDGEPEAVEEPIVGEPQAEGTIN